MVRKIKEKKTIGKMSQTRKAWAFNASTQVVVGTKGKVPYNRSKNKYRGDEE
jgi:hypothetical protein